MKYFHIMLFTLLCFFSSLVFAKDINLYDQPQDKAKVIGTVDLAAGVIPIFTPKDSSWVKIADPRNGNVGWVKSSEISSDTITFTQRIVNTGSPQSFQIIQVGHPQTMTTKQAQEAIQKMQMQQRQLQTSAQKAIEEMMKNMNNVFQEQWKIFKDSGVPFVMPIVIVPAQQGSKTQEKK